MLFFQSQKGLITTLLRVILAVRYGLNAKLLKLRSVIPPISGSIFPERQLLRLKDLERLSMRLVTLRGMFLMRPTRGLRLIGSFPLPILRGTRQSAVYILEAVFLL